MTWTDFGSIFRVSRLTEWAVSHAYVPTAIELDDRIRVFVAFWDAHRIGRLGFIDVDRDDPRQIVGVSSSPLLDDSDPGRFDCDGVTPLSTTWVGSHLRLYYAGWRRMPEPIRYTLFTGLAISHDCGATFRRHSEEPILGPDSPDCNVRTGGVVLKDGERWRCWYANHVGRIELHGQSVPSYELATIESPDGISWTSHPKTAIPVRPGEVFGYGRSAIWRSKTLYHGLFSVRSTSGGYRFIGYAKSPDGVTWTRPSPRDMGFPAGATCDGQSEVCFPSLIFRSDRIFMFYNGNNFGHEGLRLAVWQD